MSVWTDEPEQNSADKTTSSHLRVAHGFFFMLLAACTLSFFPSRIGPMAAESQDAVARLEQEFISEENESQIEDLLELGDELLERKLFERALEAYEQVFLLEPDHVAASARIDQLKEQMMHEGRGNTRTAGSLLVASGRIDRNRRNRPRPVYASEDFAPRSRE
jgi:hypothetical protein